METSAVIPIPLLPEAPAAPTRRTDAKTMLLAGIFSLLLLITLHEAADIAVPLVLACVLKLVLHPLLRRLNKWRVPRLVAASMIIAVLVSGMFMVGSMLSGPAASWGERIPSSLPQLKERLQFIKMPVEKTQKILVQADDFAKPTSQKVTPVVVQGTRLSDRIFTGTQAFASGLFTTMLILFFLLAAGDTFLRRLVEVLPRFSDKRQAVDISNQVEQDISSYLLTITAMNACVGIASAIIMEMYGVGDPILWGLVAFILNYIPIVGPLVVAALFALVGLLSIDNLWNAFSPAALYFAVHILEGSIVTPMLLAKRFTLNPVLVILSLVFWSWMWGVPGAILAMPMLAITKIICDRIQRLAPLGHFLGG